jgi:hypothetical protein
MKIKNLKRTQNQTKYISKRFHCGHLVHEESKYDIKQKSSADSQKRTMANTESQKNHVIEIDKMSYDLNIF